jgi:hypothetical protein
LFNSAKRARALSKSKVPPQQPDRLLDLLDETLNFRAHLFNPLGVAAIATPTHN